MTKLQAVLKAIYGEHRNRWTELEKVTAQRAVRACEEHHSEGKDERAER